MKKTCVLTALMILSGLLFSNVINTNRIAKIANEVILKSDVEKYSRRNDVSFDTAKKMLIEVAILYTGASMYAIEPTDEEVTNKIKKDKAYYAGLYGKEVKNVSDEEFLAYLNYRNLSMSTYQKDVKKSLWINRLIDDNFDKEKSNLYLPSDKEIENLIKTQSELFEEEEGVLLSMIYFSFYDQNGIKKSKNEIDNTYTKSNDCLFEIKKGINFEKLVVKFSDDLISKNNKPKGRVGFLAFDDPRTIPSFSVEIINELRKSDKDIIKRIFETKNGLYIFRIDEKYKPIKLSDEEARVKAEGILISKYKDNLREIAKQKLIKMLKEKIDIKYY